MRYRLSECVAIGVGDKAKGLAFYQDVLGFERGDEAEGWVEVRAGAVRLFLCEDGFETPTFELLVEDLDASLAALLAAGCEVLDLGGRETFLRDPFGQVFCLTRAPAP